MSSTPPSRTPVRQVLHNLRLTIGAYLDAKSTDVNHKDVIKELYSNGTNYRITMTEKERL